MNKILIFFLFPFLTTAQQDKMPKDGRYLAVYRQDVVYAIDIS